MAEFVVSCEGHSPKLINTGTSYAAAHKFAETVLSKKVSDEDEFDVTVLEKASGKQTSYTVRASISTIWVVTRRAGREGVAG